MSEKTRKITYYIATVLLTIMMLLSVSMYLFNNEEIGQVFDKLGYPSYLIYPLAVAKILGLIAIWTRISQPLKEWAYAGFFFDFTLAFFAHLSIADGEQFGALIASVLLMLSYNFQPKSN